MALHKFSKPKTFHVDYCGCTAATHLTNESSIRDAINVVRQVKSKRDFVKTTISATREGVRIIYDNDQKFSTNVPSSMIASSTVGKSSYQDTVGVVYISPPTGRHYPAFVHVYRCDSTRTAQKLLVRLRTYMLNDTHRSKVMQLEQHFLQNNLLNLEQQHSSKTSSHASNTTTLNSDKTNTNISSSSTNSSSQQEKFSRVKSLTEELKKKLDSQEPILYPPKDYDTMHAAHGNIQRAQAWKSTEPTIVGYTPIDPDNNQIKLPNNSNKHLSSNNSTVPNIKNSELSNSSIDKNGRPRFTTNRSDTTIDPVEAVSLAFEFLKDETGSILTEADGNIESLDVPQQPHHHQQQQQQQPDKPPVFRFRPPPITAFTKKIFTRNNNYELPNSLPPPNPALKKELHEYYQNAYYQRQHMPNSHRARSEASLLYDQEPRLHLSPRYESRLVNGSGAPISTNPLWASTSPILATSQPNILSYQSSISSPLYQEAARPSNVPHITSALLQHPLYTSYPYNKPSVSSKTQEHQHKRLVSVPPLSSPSNSAKKVVMPAHYLDTNEFILRACDGQSSNNSLNSNRSTSVITRDYRPNAVNVNAPVNTMLDVYY